MALNKYRLGELIELSNETNYENKYGLSDLKGMSVKKVFIETKADMNGVSLTPYLLVKPDYFSYVTVTSRNSEKITLAHNTTDNTYIVSSSYIVFYVKRKDLLNSDYLFMYFNRPEFDRYSRFNSWGSARETFSWEDVCDIEIELPPIEIQQKYVDIYNALLANQKSYEQGLDDLKFTCDAYIEDLRRKMPCKKIGPYIDLIEKANAELNYNINDVRGVSIEKMFIETKADMTGVNLSSYWIVEPNEFAYVPVTSRNGEKISLALNDSDNACICSSTYVAFKCKDNGSLLPQFLMLFLSRNEFNRFSRFHSWGSARETFTWNDMCEVEIPITSIETQKAISSLYTVYKKRKQINEELKSQIKDICPILIKGSLEEASETN